MPLKITEDDIEAYQNDGAVLIKNLLNNQEVSDLREGIEANISNPSLNSKIASNKNDPGWFLEDFCNWQKNPSYQRIIFESSVPEVASKLMRSKQVRLYHDHMLVKKKGTLQRTPWHQDQPYYNIEGNQNISFWIPVDPVPLKWTLELVAGSHKGPWYMPRNFLENHQNPLVKWHVGEHASVRNPPQPETSCSKKKQLKVKISIPSIFFFHFKFVHAV